MQLFSMALECHWPKLIKNVTGFHGRSVSISAKVSKSFDVACGLSDVPRCDIRMACTSRDGPDGPKCWEGATWCKVVPQ